MLTRSISNGNCRQRLCSWAAFAMIQYIVDNIVDGLSLDDTISVSAEPIRVGLAIGFSLTISL